MTASAYGRLTPRMAWQLAAPHTWPAAILPVLVAAAAAAVTTFSISATMVCVLLVICEHKQSAVNTFNDSPIKSARLASSNRRANRASSRATSRARKSVMTRIARRWHT